MARRPTHAFVQLHGYRERGFGVARAMVYCRATKLLLVPGFDCPSGKDVVDRRSIYPLAPPSYDSEDLTLYMHALY